MPTTTTKPEEEKLHIDKKIGFEKRLIRKRPGNRILSLNSATAWSHQWKASDVPIFLPIKVLSGKNYLLSPLSNQGGLFKITNEHSYHILSGDEEGKNGEVIIHGRTVKKRKIN